MDVCLQKKRILVVVSRIRLSGYVKGYMRLDNLALLWIWRLRFVSVASSRLASVSSICLVKFMLCVRLNSNASLSIVLILHFV